MANNVCHPSQVSVFKSFESGHLRRVTSNSFIENHEAGVQASIFQTFENGHLRRVASNSLSILEASLQVSVFKLLKIDTCVR